LLAASGEQQQQFQHSVPSGSAAVFFLRQQQRSGERKNMWETSEVVVIRCKKNSKMTIVQEQ
jgi:hypothetical protein